MKKILLVLLLLVVSYVNAQDPQTRFNTNKYLRVGDTINFISTHEWTYDKLAWEHLPGNITQLKNLNDNVFIRNKLHVAGLAQDLIPDSIITIKDGELKRSPITSIVSETDPYYRADTSNIAYLTQQNTFTRDQIINTSGNPVRFSSYVPQYSLGENLIIGNGIAPNLTGNIASHLCGAQLVFIGDSVAYKAGRTSQGVAIGPKAAYELTTATNFVALGVHAAHYVQDATDWVALGTKAFYENQHGVLGTAVGTNCLENSLGDKQTGLGAYAGFYNTQHENIFLGYKAGMYDTTGSHHLYIEASPADSLSAIIYGDMAKDWLRLNADVTIKSKLNIGSVAVGSTANRILVQDTVTGWVKRVPFANISTTMYRYSAINPLAVSPSQAIEILATGLGVTATIVGTAITFTIPSGVHLISAKIRIGSVSGITISTGTTDMGNTDNSNRYPPIVQAWREDTGQQLMAATTRIDLVNYDKIQITGLINTTVSQIRINF